MLRTMVRGVCWYLVGSVVLGSLGVLAGCSQFFAEREPWRRDAEVACLSSGAVREGAGKVRIQPINGPGACGADFPIKVSGLGEGASLSFGDELRPPSAIPNSAMPRRWPGEPGPYDSSAGYPSPAIEARPLDAPVASPYEPRPRQGQWRQDQPLSLDPRATAQEPYRVHARPPALGPAQGRPVAAGPVMVTPAATLACPLVSALDQWVAAAVQPAAMRWFGQPVIEIKQISAYACRGMNGNPNAHISEHAFGNALDIAAFTLADGRKIAVRSGWYGAPEEQGFLRDVHGSACDRFATVLAPGSDSYHYDHIHVDLMRRASGHRACNPRAVSGEEAAARARARHAGRRGDITVTGSVSPRRRQLGSPLAPNEGGRTRLPAAVPGEDGEGD